jgi:ATP-binding protein involved in chromosome partitioning
VSFRGYRQVAGGDRSGVLEQVIAQRERVRTRLREVTSVVAVMSGKGGVGKSWVTASLAVSLARRLTSVGVLDADLKGPTTARLLGAAGPLAVTDGGVRPAIGIHGIPVISSDILIEDAQPLAWRDPGGDRFVWRGVFETNAVREFLSDVMWGALDVLLVDLPPGSDRVPDLAQLVPAESLRGALVVTIPSDESRRSVERAMHAAREVNVPLLGVIDNMSGYRCAGCEETRPLFKGDAGEHLASQFGVPLLAKIPFDPDASLENPSFPDEVFSSLAPRA